MLIEKSCKKCDKSNSYITSKHIIGRYFFLDTFAGNVCRANQGLWLWKSNLLLTNKKSVHNFALALVFWSVNRKVKRRWKWVLYRELRYVYIDGSKTLFSRFKRLLFSVKKYSSTPISGVSKSSGNKGYLKSLRSGSIFTLFKTHKYFTGVEY
jgi:hypothetical protein